MRILIIVLLAMGIAACIHDSIAEESGDTQPGQVEYTKVSEGYRSSIIDTRYNIISNSGGLSLFLSSITITGESPNTDFETSMLISIMAGTTACQTVEVNGVEENEATVIVKATLKSVSGVCSPNIGPPYVMIEIPKTSKPVSVVFE